MTTPLYDRIRDGGDDDQTKKPRWGYQVVGTFDRLPDLVERPVCGACEIVREVIPFPGTGGKKTKSGMARRIALARAIALDPELIMYDEPFAGLDLISMGVAAKLIRTLNDVTDATSLVISHDVPECMAISDHVVLLASGGRIVAQGTPAELMASSDPETRQFVRGEPDGPVKFHYPAPEIATDFGVEAR